jgi:hypothetical protein
VLRQFRKSLVEGDEGAASVACGEVKHIVFRLGPHSSSAFCWIPIDAQLAKPEAVAHQLVSLENVAGALRRVKGRRIAYFDTCYDNPKARELESFGMRVGDFARGMNLDGLTLARTPCHPKARDSLATSDSPFTAAILRALQETARPGIDSK